MVRVACRASTWSVIRHSRARTTSFLDVDGFTHEREGVFTITDFASDFLIRLLFVANTLPTNVSVCNLASEEIPANKQPGLSVQGWIRTKGGRGQSTSWIVRGRCGTCCGSAQEDPASRTVVPYLHTKEPSFYAMQHLLWPSKCVCIEGTTNCARRTGYGDASHSKDK
jgi:hypothetical protein